MHRAQVFCPARQAINSTLETKLALIRFKYKDMSSELSVQAKHRSTRNYLRTYRKRTGLSQRELGHLLGYSKEGTVSRHEQSKTVPPLRVAIAYEIILQSSVSELFPEITERTRAVVEQRLREFQMDLQKGNSKGGQGRNTAQKLAWVTRRRIAKLS